MDVTENAEENFVTSLSNSEALKTQIFSFLHLSVWQTAQEPLPGAQTTNVMYRPFLWL